LEVTIAPATDRQIDAVREIDLAWATAWQPAIRAAASVCRHLLHVETSRSVGALRNWRAVVILDQAVAVEMRKRDAELAGMLELLGQGPALRVVDRVLRVELVG
jgi:hypothetical protein